MSEYVVNLSNVDLALCKEQLWQTYSALPRSQTVALINAVAFVAFSWQVLPQSDLLIWFALFFGVTCWRLIDYRFYLKAEINQKNSRFWDKRFIVGVFLSGCVWGGLAWFLFPPDSPEHQMFIIFISAGMTAGGLTTLSSNPKAIRVFLFLVLLPLAARLLLTQTLMGSVMGGLVLLYLAALFTGAQSFFANFRENITLRVKAQQREESLKRSEARLNAAQKVAQVGSFEWDIKHDQLRWSDEHFRLWGFQPQIFTPTVQQFEQGLHPDDAERVKQTLLEALQGDGAYACDHRVCWADGTVRDISGRGQVIFDDNGDPALMTGTVQDISNSQRIARELLVAKKSAEAASEAKSMFLANISHELRTPMNGIIGMTYLALQTDLNTKQKNFVGKAHSSAEDLLGILNDLLDFSKIEADKIEVEQIRFDLRDVVDDVVSLFQPRAVEKQLKLEVNCDPDLPGVLLGDPLRLGQVLKNLTSNAVKFSHSGGAVWIKVTLDEVLDQQQVSVRFSVEDTGIGISEEEKNLLFRPFSQADASTTRKYGGTGLGLAISERLVKLMGGGIRVDSCENRGSSFSFTLTFCKGEDEEAMPPKELKASEVSELAALKGSRVLLVEDNEINQLVLQELLRRNGVVVEVAADGEQGLQRLTSATYDAVLMDCQMPVMDGYEATRQIRASSQLCQMPVIAMTANAMKGDREKALKVGMDDYLTKPIDPPQVLQVLDRWIGKRRDGASGSTVEVKTVTGQDSLC